MLETLIEENQSSASSNPNRAHTFTVVSSAITETTQANSLTRLQQLVCKWFKITPERKYWYVLKIKTHQQNAVKINDVVMGLDGVKWIVCYVDSDQQIQLRNIEPTVVNGMYTQMAILFRVFSE